MTTVAGVVIVCAPDVQRYREAVTDRLDAKMAVVAAWHAVHAYCDARTRRALTHEEGDRIAALRHAALECEAVLERALAREREAGDRVLKVVLHG